MPKLNGEAYYSSLGRSFTVRFDLIDLSKEERIALLHNLMEETGTTAAIIEYDTDKRVLNGIDDAWAAFRSWL